MQNLMTKGALIAVIGGTLMLGGCVSVDEVHHAQATADEALAAAHHAQETADHVGIEVNALTGRVTTLEQEMDSYRTSHHGQRG